MKANVLDKDHDFLLLQTARRREFVLCDVNFTVGDNVIMLQYCHPVIKLLYS